MKHIKLFEEVNQEPRIVYWDNGQKQSETYYINGKSHREDGPAFQSWYENGQKSHDEYHLNGKIHREDGPASYWWYRNGLDDEKIYYLNDIIYKREEWIEQLKKIGSVHYKDQKMKYEQEKYNL